MRFRIEVICVNDDGGEQRCDVMGMERRQLAMETLGLSLAEGKAILHGVQDFVTAQQVGEDLKYRRNCPICGWRYQSKDTGTNAVKTVFGTSWCRIHGRTDARANRKARKRSGPQPLG